MPKRQKTTERRAKNYENQNGCYVVEDIVNRYNLKGVIMYEVKWKGYPSSQNTLEPIDNLGSVLDMVQEFQQLMLEDNAIKKLTEWNHKKKVNISQTLKVEFSQSSSLRKQTILKQKVIKKSNRRVTKQRGKIITKTNKVLTIQPKTKKNHLQTKRKPQEPKSAKKVQFILPLKQSEQVSPKDKAQKQLIKSLVIDWLKQFEQHQSFNLFESIKACQQQLRLQRTQQQNGKQMFNGQIINGDERDDEYWRNQVNRQKYEPFDCSDSDQEEDIDEDREEDNKQMNKQELNSMSPAMNPESAIQVQSLLSEICKHDQNQHPLSNNNHKLHLNHHQQDKQPSTILTQFLDTLAKSNKTLQSHSPFQTQQIKRILSDKYLQILSSLNKLPTLTKINHIFRLQSQVIFDISSEQFTQESKYLSGKTMVMYYRRQFDDFVMRMMDIK